MFIKFTPCKFKLFLVWAILASTHGILAMDDDDKIPAGGIFVIEGVTEEEGNRDGEEHANNAETSFDAPVPEASAEFARLLERAYQLVPNNTDYLAQEPGYVPFPDYQLSPLPTRVRSDETRLAVEDEDNDRRSALTRSANAVPTGRNARAAATRGGSVNSGGCTIF